MRTPIFRSHLMVGLLFGSVACGVGGSQTGSKPVDGSGEAGWAGVANSATPPSGGSASGAPATPPPASTGGAAATSGGAPEPTPPGGQSTGGRGDASTGTTTGNDTPTTGPTGGTTSTTTSGGTTGGDTGGTTGGDGTTVGGTTGGDTGGTTGGDGTTVGGTTGGTPVTTVPSGTASLLPASVAGQAFSPRSATYEVGADGVGMTVTLWDTANACGLWRAGQMPSGAQLQLHFSGFLAAGAVLPGSCAWGPQATVDRTCSGSFAVLDAACMPETDKAVLPAAGSGNVPSLSLVGGVLGASFTLTAPPSPTAPAGEATSGSFEAVFCPMPAAPVCQR